MKLPIVSNPPHNLVNKLDEKLIPTIPNITKEIRKTKAALINILLPLFFIHCPSDKYNDIMTDKFSQVVICYKETWQILVILSNRAGPLVNYFTID